MPPRDEPAGRLPFQIGLTDHLEGPPDRESGEIFEEVAELVELADRLGAGYAWFTEHHAHAHHGHLPTPLLFALHMAGRTRSIRLGTAVICLNLHHPLDAAEQAAVVDVLLKGRTAIGFGSGSTPDEAALFGADLTDDRTRQARFAEALRVIQAAWSGDWSRVAPTSHAVPPHRALPRPRADLASRCWVAVNSAGSARIAGALGFNMLFSHLRTPEQYREYRAAYREAGGSGLVAANRPVYTGPDDRTAFATVEPALRTLWRRFRAEGKIPADAREPEDPAELCGHPINFIVGGPETVAKRLLELHAEVPFDVANVEVRWAGLSHEETRESLRRLLEEATPHLRGGA